MHPPRRRLLSMLLAPLLVVVLAAPTAAPDEPAQVSGIDGRISRCFELRDNHPRQAMELAESLLAGPALDPRQRIKALGCQGVAANLLGDDARAVTAADAISAELEQNPELPAPYRMRALSNLGRILHGAGQVYRAEKVYSDVMRLGGGLRGEDATRAQASTLNNIGLINADYLDAPQAADGYLGQAVELTRASATPDPQVFYNFAINRLRLDDHDAAREALEEAGRAATARGSVLMELRIRSALAGLSQEGGAAGNMPVLEQIASLQAGLPDPAGEAATLARLSAAQRHAGQHAQALQSARRAYEQARTTHGPQETYLAMQALVDALAASGQTRAALDYAGRMGAMKLDALRQQRMDLLADLQARNHDISSQRELERMRYEDSILHLREEKSRALQSAALGLLLILLLGSLAFAMLQRRRHQQLRTLSERDALTGLANRRAATHALNALAAQRCSDDTRHVLFLIDIDHFKQINDTHGHHTGDEVLVDVARRLQAACGPDDLVSRWGGEEFLVACANLDPARAQAMAGHLCQAMAWTLATPEGGRALTASLGLAPIPFFDVMPEEHGARRWDYALRMADRALYAAKEQRNGWVGYWGAQLPDDATAEAVLEFPEAAPGIVHVMSSRPRSLERLRQQSLREAVAQL